MAGNSGPGYAQHPAHRVELLRQGKRVCVVFGGETIADSADVITLAESNHSTVYYLPRKDVKMERLVRTAHHTYCPFKGEASYYSLSAPGKTAENAVWTYETPYDEVLEIRDRLAFYPDRVDSISVT